MGNLKVTVFQRKKFRKDVRIMRKRGKKIEKLEKVVSMLARGKELSDSYRDHSLLGEYTGCRECHLEPDWLLIYKIQEGALHLVRTGTHADLFKKY